MKSLRDLSSNGTPVADEFLSATEVLYVSAKTTIFQKFLIYACFHFLFKV